MQYQGIHTVDAPLKEVWGFFERPDAFERLAPPWASIRIVEKSQGLQKGAIVTLRLPLGIIWKVQHVDYLHGAYFVDEQIKGPFRFWHHRHSFEEISDHQTRLIDTVTFSLPLSFLLNPLLGWLVKSQLKRLFAYRKEVLERELQH